MKYICNPCNFETNKKKDLEIHIQSDNHKEIEEDIQEKNYNIKGKYNVIKEKEEAIKIKNDEITAKRMELDNTIKEMEIIMKEKNKITKERDDIIKEKKGYAERELFLKQLKEENADLQEKINFFAELTKQYIIIREKIDSPN